MEMDVQSVKIANKAVELVGLVLSVIFFGFGIGLLTGLILPDAGMFSGWIRVVVGLVLVAYGIVRGVSSYGRLRGSGKGEEDE